MAIVKERLYLILIVLLALSLSDRALSCTVPPTKRESALSALERAKAAGVVSVTSIRATKENLIVTLGPVQVLRGSKSQLRRLVLKCKDCAGHLPPTDQFEIDRQSLDFLDGMRTSLRTFPDCTQLPRLEVGKSYLYIKTVPKSRFILEQVDSMSDSWLELARDYYKTGEFAPLSVQEYLSSADRVAVVQCVAGTPSYVCANGVNSFLHVQESANERMLFPENNAGCYDLSEFKRRHGFDLAGLASSSHYCHKR